MRDYWYQSLFSLLRALLGKPKSCKKTKKSISWKKRVAVTIAFKLIPLIFKMFSNDD